MTDASFQKGFADQNRRDQVAFSTLASVLSMILMPMGAVMDRYQYPELSPFFLRLRLASSAIVGLAWVWFRITGEKHYRMFGVVWYLAPTVFIAWMVEAAPGPMSPYYAGLNLVLLALGVLSSWTFVQNLASALFVIAMFLGAYYLKPPPRSVASLFNDLFFLVSTAAIVVGGSCASYRQRLRAFRLRWELDTSRQNLEDSNQKLLEMDELKNRFFANISHELRTPLTLLLAPLEDLLHRFSRALDQETRGMLETMHCNGMRLLKLINDLLELVRLESGRTEVKREPLEVAEFISGLASAARQVAEEKRLKLETAVDPALGTLLADRDKLEKIVLNLVFNALKFTPAGGLVRVSAEKQGTEFVLSVADTGMGISEKNLPHVFDRFWQADGSSRRKYQGAGIGLALVKELAELLGGKVTVKSEERKGTIFLVRLPYQEAASVPKAESGAQAEEAGGAEADGAGVESEEWLANLYRRAELFPAITSPQDSVPLAEMPRNGTPPRVLVADDEPDMRRFLRSQLRARYHVIEAADGQQAVEKASQFLPELVVLDMMMPEKDGVQACREIRRHTPTRNVPILMLTARADEETKLLALSAGASDFLAKPFSTTELHVRIKNLVESHRYQSHLSKQNQVLENTIDQLKDTETQLVQSEKLASLGRMSAGLIHEVNNPLNFATTGLYALRNKAKLLSPEQREEYLEILADVEDGVKRVKNIVSDLRLFTHPEIESRDNVPVAEALGAALRFLSSQWKGLVRIEQELPERQTVWANRNLLVHVLVNLLQNSIDALKNKRFDVVPPLAAVGQDGPGHAGAGGPESAAPEQPTIRIDGRLEGQRSLVIVRDNGPGIESKNLDKIFDPFFTTKDVGEGMGLGLAICYRIVHDCQGRISVRTEPGRFCEFTLDLPAGQGGEQGGTERWSDGVME